MEPVIRKKLVMVGDGAGGKTSLLIVFTKGIFPEEYVPTVFENHVVDVHLDEYPIIQLALWDTAGQEDYNRLRPLSYPGSDVIIVCFSIASPDSLDNVESQWVGEIRHYCGPTPIILVGCKKDLRSDPATIAELARSRQHPVTFEEGAGMAQKIGAFRYVECSAKYNDGVSDVFEFATRAAMLTHSKPEVARAKKTNKCQLL
ncbi:GTP-binding protein rho1 [Zopfochytrium polystomum]|nr:GTP-binding protein rho1 [Zopfochytrium polystomum]